MESTKDLAYKLKYYMFGMDELEAMFSARDAEVAKQARAECAERAVEWLYPKNGIYNCCLSDGMEREKRKESLRLAITQGAQGQSEPRDAPVPFELVAAECPDRITLKVSREWWEKHLIELNTKGEIVLRGFAEREATK